MFLRKLTEEDKMEFLKYATFMALSEAPGLWGGKRLDELTSNDRFVSLSLSDELDIFNHLFELKSECIVDEKTSVNEIFYDGYSIKSAFENSLKELPLHKVDSAESRIQSLRTLMESTFSNESDEEEDSYFSSPESVKIVIFELLMMASKNGGITEVKQYIIDFFAEKYRIEDFVVEDLSRQVDDLISQLNKTLSIILE